MSNLHLNHSALEECLRTLDHLFIDIARLTYEQGYEEIVGGYCELKVATLDSGIPTAKLVAAKRLRLGVRATEPKRLAFRLARELKVWAGLQHPHVLPLLGFYLGNDYKSTVLMSEYMSHGDLKNYIREVKPSLSERLCLVRDLTDGLAYLHTRSAAIRHGDLKPGNVLVNSDRRALLADFGLSKALDTGPTGFTTGNDARGTIRYSSPEILLQGRDAESLSNDIWSWGCLALEALTDKIPFADIQSEPQLIVALVQGRSPNNKKNIPFCPQQLKKLLAKCWSRQPNERPAAVDCLSIIASTLPRLGSERGVGVPHQPPSPSPLSSSVLLSSTHTQPAARYSSSIPTVFNSRPIPSESSGQPQLGFYLPPPPPPPFLHQSVPLGYKPPPMMAGTPLGYKPPPMMPPNPHGYLPDYFFPPPTANSHSHSRAQQLLYLGPGTSTHDRPGSGAEFHGFCCTSKPTGWRTEGIKQTQKANAIAGAAAAQRKMRRRQQPSPQKQTPASTPSPEMQMPAAGPGPRDDPPLDTSTLKILSARATGRTEIQRFSLERSAEEDEAGSKGSAGPSGSSKRAPKNP